MLSCLDATAPDIRPLILTRPARSAALMPFPITKTERHSLSLETDARYTLLVIYPTAIVATPNLW